MYLFAPKTKTNMDVFKTLSNIYDRVFLWKYINFRKKAPFQIFDKLFSTALKNDGTSDLLS